MAAAENNPAIEKAVKHIRNQCSKLKSDITNARLMYDLDDMEDSTSNNRALLLLDGWLKYTVKRVDKLAKSKDTEDAAIRLAKIAEDIQTVSKALKGYA